MNLSIPNLCFALARVPMTFETDGSTQTFAEHKNGPPDPERIAVLTLLQAHQMGVAGHPHVTVSESVTVPKGLRAPVIFDGTQELAGRNVLVLMYNGWGDTILLQPALRALWEGGKPSERPAAITVACNWVRNFPYPEAPFISAVRPNVLSLEDLCRYDVLVSLAGINYVRSADWSMLDLCLDTLGLCASSRVIAPPRLTADPARVARLRQAMDDIRKKTGKRLLCVNWRSRFHHKNAPAPLFGDIVEGLRRDYAALLFKDAESAEIMRKEIVALGMAVKDCSGMIGDMHDTIAALSLMDAFVSVDTGIIHAAGALDIPGVALFGPFPPETHVAVYPSVRGLRADYQGTRCSGPCLETHRGCAEADFSPERPSPCFTALRADEIIAQLGGHVAGMHQGRRDACASS